MPAHVVQAPKPGYAREREAVHQACVLVAARYSLDPQALQLPGKHPSIVEARRIVWLILRDVSRWNVALISDVMGWERSTVQPGLRLLEAQMRSDRKLRAHVESCVREAAGDS